MWLSVLYKHEQNLSLWLHAVMEQKWDFQLAPTAFLGSNIDPVQDNQAWLTALYSMYNVPYIKMCMVSSTLECAWKYVLCSCFVSKQTIMPKTMQGYRSDWGMASQHAVLCFGKVWETVVRESAGVGKTNNVYQNDLCLCEQGKSISQSYHAVSSPVPVQL